MKIIYSGFDTITFAVQGALKPEAIKTLRLCKTRAEHEEADYPIKLGDISKDIYLKPNGQKGGYAFVLDMGFDAQIISLKDNIILTNWNGLVKIRAINLALNGYEKAIQSSLDKLKAIGFEIKNVSMNRVDYAMDVLTAVPIVLDPANVVTHSHRQVKSHYEPIVTVAKSRQVQSVTIGKMPGSQIIIYDKLAEVKAKLNYEWFKIWGIKRDAEDTYIKRVEIRAGKDALKAANISSIEAFYNRIGPALRRLVSSTRYVQGQSPDSNMSRRANHPLWKQVTSHIESGILAAPSDINPDGIELIRKEVKREQYNAQILGSMMGLAVCSNIPFENIADVIDLFTDDIADMMRENSHFHETYGKKYARAKDRLRF